MSWKAYRLAYQAKSPIHIGWYTLGYIKLTRYYITGRNVWGAMTANLTRSFCKYEDYNAIGKLLGCDRGQGAILISYLYPALDIEQPLLPRYSEKGIKYGQYAKPYFEKRFIKSYGQTAVIPDSNTAEDESLHESEYIAPIVVDEGIQRDVYFVGYIFINDNAEFGNIKFSWQSIHGPISELFVGGDRKYGWGRLLLKDNRELKNDEEVFGFPVNLKSKKPFLTILSGKPIPSHVMLNSDLRIKGDIEPVLGLEISQKGFGKKISDAKMCWMPGSILIEKSNFFFDEFGILNKLEES